MCAHKTNVNSFRSKLNHNNQSVIITLYVEHIMLITDIINAIESMFNIRKTGP